MPENLAQRMNFEDGEGVDFNDFNALQAILDAFYTDTLLGALGSPPELQSYRLDGTLVSNRVTWVPAADQAAPIPDVGVRSLTNTAGLIMLCDNGAKDGTTRRVKSYYVESGEIALAAGDLPADPTNPRFAAIYLKLDEFTDASESRDFEDATTHVITTSTPNKRRRNSLSVITVLGTPAATPVAPNLGTTGYHLWCHVLIPAAYGATFTGSHIADARITLNQRAHYVPASHFLDYVDGTKWPIQYATADMPRQAANGTDKTRCAIPMPPASRLIGVRLFGTFGANVIVDIRDQAGTSYGPGYANGLFAGAVPTGGMINLVGDPIYSATTLYKGGPYWVGYPPYYPPKVEHLYRFFLDIDPHGAGDLLSGACFYWCQ